MNKLERNLLKRKHFIRRIKNYCSLDPAIAWHQFRETGRAVSKDGGIVDFNGFRTTGKPCSCAVCSGEKYKRSEEKKNFRREAGL